MAHTVRAIGEALSCSSSCTAEVHTEDDPKDAEEEGGGLRRSVDMVGEENARKNKEEEEARKDG